MRAETGTSSAWAISKRIEIVGDFAARSTSEIIDEETPLLDDNPRNDKPSCLRRFLIAWATRLASVFAVVDNIASIAYSSDPVRNTIRITTT
jgi:hypothetical protein